jgi:hypothetical protein
MENKPINRIKVMLAERMVSNKELAEMLGKDPAERHAAEVSEHKKTDSVKTKPTPYVRSKADTLLRRDIEGRAKRQ